MNPNLYDLIKLHVAEKHPKLVVQFWSSPTTYDSQIRISTEEIEPFSKNIRCSLISIVKRENDYAIYYVGKNDFFWLVTRLKIESPEFFDKLDEIIDKLDEIIVNSVRNKIQKTTL